MPIIFAKSLKCQNIVEISSNSTLLEKKPQKLKSAKNASRNFARIFSFPAFNLEL